MQFNEEHDSSGDVETSFKEISEEEEEGEEPYHKQLTTKDHHALSTAYSNLDSAFYILDSGNLTINDIFQKKKKEKNYSKHALESFKSFIVELKIWGSYTPIRILLDA